MKTDYHSRLYHSKGKETFLYTWLNTTKFLMETKLNKTKLNNVGKLTNDYQKQDTNIECIKYIIAM